MIVHYPEELDVMNHILDLPLPRCILEGSGSRKNNRHRTNEKELDCGVCGR
ncbi:hypothetical protein [Cytobacillus massiliigabonensis]|uniref:hypothetical protein n=1 Tax=Cytobacillus massiliigabonensis TaxID=1871011 RepID=UPI0015E0D49A|nr:hypothetical protein [Cytobacillus massiliigabonensis]